MTHPRNDRPSGPPPATPATVPAEPLPAPPVPGRGHPAAETGLRKLRDSWVLKATAVVAFLSYGGLIALLLARKLDFSLAGVVALMSLASWFFLFWWYPVFERTLQKLGGNPRRQALAASLEIVAVGCVLVVHALMAIIVVYAARN